MRGSRRGLVSWLLREGGHRRLRVWVLRLVFWRGLGSSGVGTVVSKQASRRDSS